MTRIFADGHVHVYPEYDPRSFGRAAAARAAEYGGPLLLCLADVHGAKAFTELDATLWEPAGESRSRRMRSGVAGESTAGRDAHPVHVVCGRQLVSAEGLEVLALALDPTDPLNEEPARERGARDLARAGLERGAIVVLPWGVGKWIGARGRLVERLVADADLRRHPRFFLGDIAHRIGSWPHPGGEEAVRVLPGSDVLPLPGDEARVARYGFSIDVRWDPDRPAAALLEALEEGRDVVPVGRREPPWRVVRDQLRYRRHRARSRGRERRRSGA